MARNSQLPPEIRAAVKILLDAVSDYAQKHEGVVYDLRQRLNDAERDLAAMKKEATALAQENSSLRHKIRSLHYGYR